MTTFLIGLSILVVFGYFYGLFVEKHIVKPDDRVAPCYLKSDGVDFVPMKTWRNSMLNLISIAGTGPIVGPILGILFGPITFILIPLGCVFAGAVHDYMSGTISMRNNGAQMPNLVRKFTNGIIHNIYIIFTALLLFLVAAVFTYMPGDLFAGQVLGIDTSPTSGNQHILWIIYGVILAYYLLATVMPVHKLIGKFYPILGFILLSSGVALTIMLGVGFVGGNFVLDNVNAYNWRGVHPAGLPLIPIFFLTVACGILSGFHATQNTMVARSVPSEKKARTTFYTMMIAEGFLAMVWAAAAMAVMNAGLVPAGTGAIAIIGIVSNTLLGPFGVIVILCAVLLAITSGDTCLRALRLIIAERIKSSQSSLVNRFKISIPIFIVTGGLIVWAQINPGGFDILWRYFAWSNQSIGIFALAIATIYLIARGQVKGSIVTLVPGVFYTFITMSYILSSPVGFRLPFNVAHILACVLCVLYAWYIFYKGNKLRKNGFSYEDTPVFEIPKGAGTVGK